ncbi:hypothetical protein AAFO92_09005 [Roseovarius sp. CAU 1744]|uniref:hypothetical protein n=1 Tax=Roseovarius sp. CAU 1744 TaxID=3140368 RepID=UPI00325B041D
MSDSGKSDRISVQDILAEQGIRTASAASGDSKSTITTGLAGGADMSKGDFLGVVLVGEQLGKGLGLSSKKEVTRHFRDPYDIVLKAMVLAMSAGDTGLTAATDTRRGAILMGGMPSDILSTGGRVEFDVVDLGQDGTEVIGASEIKGQMFAWGKGKRTLNGVLDEAERMARRL